MSYTNETTHFGIPKPLGSDLTTPMDYNTAADAVDAALFEAQTNASHAATDASNAVNTANQAATDVGDLGADLNIVKGRTTALEQSDVIQDNKIDNLEIKTPTKFDSVGIADAYVNGLTYAVGDVVTYNGQRYVCNTAVTAAEPFDADKWTARDIQTELDQINSELPRHTLLGEIVADGVKTRALILAELTALIDFTKLRVGVSVLDVNGQYAYTHDQFISTNNTAYFGIGNNVIRQISLQKNGTPSDTYYILGTSTTPQDVSSDVPPVGTTFRVYA